MSTLADRLRRAMTDAGPRGAPVTQAALARACHVSPQAVGQWLNGSVAYLRPEPLVRAARFLGVSTDWLATGRGPRARQGANSLTADEARLLRAFRDLPPDLRAALLLTADRLAPPDSDPE